MKSKKNVHAFGDLLNHLESLEMLDMSYTVEKLVTERHGEPVFYWEIEYEVGAPLPAYDAVSSDDIM